MTNVSVFNGHEGNDGGKKMEFIYMLKQYDGGLSPAQTTPNQWDNVMLMSKNPCSEGKGFDIIVAWNKDTTLKVIYLGHWNDGVVW